MNNFIHEQQEHIEYAVKHVSIVSAAHTLARPIQCVCLYFFLSFLPVCVCVCVEYYEHYEHYEYENVKEGNNSNTEQDDEKENELRATIEQEEERKKPTVK